MQFETVFQKFADVRYFAIYRNGQLSTFARENLEAASDSESDQYEELLVNPTLLTLVRQRGDIDCGGLDYVLIRYGNFFQFVEAIPGGHVSICIQPQADAVEVGQEAAKLLRKLGEW